MTSQHRNMFDEGGFAKDVSVVVRFAGAEKVRRASVRSVDYVGTVDAPVSREGDALKVTLPRHHTASMVFLEA